MQYKPLDTKRKCLAEMANKSNRIARATVDLLTREGGKGATESMANTTLPDDQEL